MTVEWGIKERNVEPEYGRTIGFNKRSEDIYLRVSNGLGILNKRQQYAYKRFDEPDGYKGSISYGDSKLFDFWNETGSPTERIIYRNYFAGDEANWRPKLDEYRRVINAEKPGLKQLLKVLYPVLDSLVDGDYVLNICDMLPTDGNDNYFYEREGVMKVSESATIEFPIYGDYSSMNTAFPMYLVPTQSQKLTDTSINSPKETSGMGISIDFAGFKSYLIDGHHKAKSAFEHRQTLPCIEIRLQRGDIQDVNFYNFSEIPDNLNYYASNISNYQFLDYPTTEDIVMTYDYFSEYSGLSPASQAEKLKATLVHGQTQEGMRRIIQGLFYSHNVSEYLRLAPIVRDDYPFSAVYRCYYGLLTNWLERSEVQDILMQFLIDDISDDDQLNQFIAERIVAVAY